MSVVITLKVTIGSFKAEPTEKGNFMARNISSEIVSVEGAKEEQLQLFNFANKGSVAFGTQTAALVKSTNKKWASNKGSKRNDGQKMDLSSMPQELREALMTWQASQK